MGAEPMSRRTQLAALLLSAMFGLPAAAQEDGPQPDELFQKLDKNGDGRLAADEIGDEQQRFFERLVRVGDADEDGELTKDEFTKGLQRGDQPGARPQGDRPDRSRSSGRQFFERLDQNKDGKLAKDEVPEPLRERLNPLFERLEKEELTAEDFERLAGRGGDRDGGTQTMFRRLDSNGDGKLTKDEIPEPVRERFGRLFERLGKDEATAEEFARFVGQSAPPAGGGQPGGGPALFRLLDTDRDGRLSKDELAKAADHFGELDRNKDGAVDPRELLGFGPPDQGGRPGARPEGGRRGEFDPAVWFRRLDANEDDKLSKDEVRATGSTRENFDEIDRDGDGSLSRDEYTERMQRFSRGRTNRESDERRRGEPK
jgi:Ca2+-binding EF-hand superfamily protein